MLGLGLLLDGTGTAVSHNLSALFLLCGLYLFNICVLRTEEAKPAGGFRRTLAAGRGHCQVLAGGGAAD